MIYNCENKHSLKINNFLFHNKLFKLAPSILLAHKIKFILFPPDSTHLIDFDYGNVKHKFYSLIDINLYVEKALALCSKFVFDSYWGQIVLKNILFY